MILNENTEIKDLLTEVVELTKFADADSNFDYFTKTAWETKQAEARQKLPNLRTRLQNRIADRLVKVYVSGSEAHVNELIDMLKVEIPVFTVKPFYQEVAECVEPTLGREQEITGTTYLRLNDVLRKFASSYMITPYNMLPQPTSVVVSNMEQLMTVVRDTTRGAFGDMLNGAYIFHHVTNEAVSQGFTKEAGLVVLTNVTKEEKKGLNGIVFHNTNSIDVVLKTKPDKSNIVSILKKVSEGLSETEEE